jgi:hypothetical protein
VNWDGEKTWDGYEFPSIHCPFCTGNQRSTYDKGFESGFQEACKAIVPPGSGPDSFNGFNRLHKITREIAQAVAATKSWLSFDGLKPLPHETWQDCFPVEASEAFLTYQGEYLDLSSLKETGEKQLRNISECRAADLNLAGLTLLPGNSADFLGNHKGNLTLGLEDLSEKDAKGLSKKRGGLRLPHLKEITPEAASHFKGFSGSLSLGISRIDPQTAGSLSKIKGSRLQLESLDKIDTSSAKELGSFNGSLCLGLKEISDAVATGLGCGSGDLILDSLELLSQTVATLFVKRSGALSLSGLKDISLDVARTLAQNKGEISLGGLEFISEDIALEFSKHRYTLRLYGLVDLSDRSAEYLAAHRAGGDEDLLFLGLPNPRESLFKSFSKHEGNLMLGIGARPFSFRKEDSHTIEPKEAEWLTKHKGKVTIRWVDALKPSVINILKACPTIEGIDYDSIEVLKETSKELKRKGA